MTQHRWTRPPRDLTGNAPNGGWKSRLALGVRSARQGHGASKALEIHLIFQRHPHSGEYGNGSPEGFV